VRLATEFPEAKSLVGTTPGGRDLGWIPGDPPRYVWRDVDGTRHPVEDVWTALPAAAASGMTFSSTFTHPSEERILHYLRDRPFDITFAPPRARMIGEAGARAVYAGDDRIAVLFEQTLILLDGEHRELARLPCPDHDCLFVVRYGRDVVTGKCEHGSATPRLYDISESLVLRGDIPAIGASKSYAKKLKEAGNRLSGLRGIRSGHGRVFLLTNMLGNYELQGL
jgi:hypothetical protein